MDVECKTVGYDSAFELDRMQLKSMMECLQNRRLL